MRTLVVSDLHLGTASGLDVLRRPGPLAALTETVAKADRLVILGDVLELRHGPVRNALAAAAPVLGALGAALGPDCELVLVPGNHDHALIAPWLEARGARDAPVPLGLEEHPGTDASAALGWIAEVAAPARVTVAYPGLWLRPDVYATHGHYLDRCITVPTFERVATGAMNRVVGPLPAAGATPDDFESGLAPLYAWMHAVAQSTRHGWTASRQSASSRGWQVLSANGPRPLRLRALRAAFVLTVAGINRAGFGPIRSELSGEELRRAGLTAMGEVVRLLGIDARHVIFGHTHRSGPLPGDDAAEWRAPGGATLHNAGCWIDEPVFATGGPSSPYWGGRVLVVEDEGPPRLERVVTDLGVAGER